MKDNLQSIYLLSHNRYLQRSLIIMTFSISSFIAIIVIAFGLYLENKLIINTETINLISTPLILIIYFGTWFYLPTRRKRFEIIRKIKALD